MITENLYAQYPEAYRPATVDTGRDPVTRRVATIGLVLVVLLVAAVLTLTLTSSTLPAGPEPVRPVTSPARAPMAPDVVRQFITETEFSPVEVTE